MWVFVPDSHWYYELTDKGEEAEVKLSVVIMLVQSIEQGCNCRELQNSRDNGYLTAILLSHSSIPPSTQSLHPYTNICIFVPHEERNLTFSITFN